MGSNAGEKCASGEVCSGGTCGASCLSGQILCNGQCIDPDTDNRYCGATGDCQGTKVGEKCDSGKVCSGGQCGITCVSDQILCKGQCIDPKTDNRYCGATGDCSGSNIGKACESGTKCTDRVCKISCVSGQIACGGECIDPNTNPYFCGAKGNCAGDDPNQTNYKGKDCTKTSTTKLCSNKICTSSCPTDQENCNGFCINKGATNVVSCNNNSIQCKDGYGNCDGNVANGCEVNINNDNAHCRGCNQKCETTTISNSASVQCTKDGCIATSCKEGYVPSSDGKKCVESGELNCCGAKCTNCYTQYPNMDTGECNASTSTCTLRTCKDGYMLNSDKTKCVEIECKNDTECGDSGKCKDSECKCGNGSACSGNKPICNAGNCVECTSISHCSSKSNATAKCERNVCEYECNIGYHKDATGNCSPNSDTSCGDREGSSVTNCASPKPRCDKNKGECVECLGTKDCENNGKGFCKTDNTCYYTECDDEYTLSENNASCVLKVKRCGSPATDCTEIENQTSVACENNFCVVKSCTGNTHVYNPTDGGMQTGHGMCEENTTENCGSHGNKCGVEDGIGQVATCEASTTPAQCEYSCATDFTDCSSTSSGTKNSELICLKKGSGWGWSDFSSTCKNCVTQDSDHCTTGQTCNRSGGAMSGYTYSCSNTK